MSTGILTYHNALNYGAFLQAYALQNFLAAQGVANVVINYKNFRFTLNEYRALVSPRYPSYTLLNFCKVPGFWRDIRRFKLTPRIFRSSFLERMSFDRVVFGSDSIWNYTNAMSGYDPAYFGKHIRSGRLVAYAASIGPDAAGDLCPGELADLLGRFHALGVRDTNTKDFVRRLTGREAQIVLDPTFLYEFEKENTEPREAGYIFVYALQLTGEQGRRLQSFARAAGKQTISVGYCNPYCDINRVCITPLEWLGYLRKADYVLTSMYHGTLLSIHFNRPFCTLGSPYRANKIQDFLSRHGLLNRMIAEQDPNFNRVLEEPLDFTPVNIQLREERAVSGGFLTRSLTDE